MVLLCNWQGPRYVTHHLPPPRMYISRKLEMEDEPVLEFRHPNPEASISSSLLTAVSNAHSLKTVFNVFEGVHIFLF